MALNTQDIKDNSILDIFLLITVRKEREGGPELVSVSTLRTMRTETVFKYLFIDFEIFLKVKSTELGLEGNMNVYHHHHRRQSLHTFHSDPQTSTSR